MAPKVTAMGLWLVMLSCLSRRMLLIRTRARLLIIAEELVICWYAWRLTPLFMLQRGMHSGCVVPAVGCGKLR